jgi:hypothetical protein
MPWARRAPAFVRQAGLAAVAGGDAHRAEDVGHVVTTFPGQTPDDVRAAIIGRTTAWEGQPYTWRRQLDMFVRQQQKNARAVGATARHRLAGKGLGRDLGYPRP